MSCVLAHTLQHVFLLPPSSIGEVCAERRAISTLLACLSSGQFSVRPHPPLPLPTASARCVRSGATSSTAWQQWKCLIRPAACAPCSTPPPPGSRQGWGGFVVVLLGPLVLVLFLGPAGLGRGGPCRAVCLIRTRLLVCCLLGWHGGAGIGSALTASSSAGVVAKANFVFRNAGARGDCGPDCQHEPGALRVHDLRAGQLWMGAHPLPGKPGCWASLV